MATANRFRLPRQMELHTTQRTGEAEEGWPADAGELPDVHEHSNWTESSGLRVTSVYGRRAA